MKQIKTQYMEKGYRVLHELLMEAIVIALVLTAMGVEKKNIGYGMAALLAMLLFYSGMLFWKQPVFYVVLLYIGGIGAVIWRIKKPENMFFPFEAVFFFAGVFLGIALYHKLSRWYWFRQIAAVLLCVGMVVCYYWEVKLPKLLIAACMVVGLYTLMQFLPEYIGSKEIRRRAEGLFPIFLLIGICTFFSPTSEEPYQWKWVKQAVHAIEQAIEDSIYFVKDRVAYPEEYHVATVGYGEEGSLFASLRGTSSNQLTIRGSRIKSGLYLKGNAENRYSFDRWEQGEMETTYPERALDVYQLFLALKNSGMSEQEMQRMVKIVRYEIQHDKLRTNSLFVGGKTLGIEAQGAVKESPNQFSMQEKEKQYVIRVAELDYGSTQFRELIERIEELPIQSPNDYEEVCAFAKEKFEVELKNIISQEEVNHYLKARNEYVEREYCILPDGLDKRIGELTEEIVKDCKTDYEKCRAVESYLSRYNYSTRVRFPEEECAVSEFLFETRSGYCVHFASAMAVMLRCEGIPTRYVEGFCENFSKQIGLETFAVQSSQAHAWVEAYIEGFGWIRLEPTPRYQKRAYVSWQYNNQAAALQLGQEADELSGESATEEKPIKEQREHTGKIIRAVGIMSMSVIVIFLGMLIFKKWYAGYQYKTASNLKKKKILWEKISFYLKEIEGEQREYETLKEYLGRVNCLKKEEAKEILHIYYQTGYGRENIRNEQIMYLEKASDRLRLGYLSVSGQQLLKRRIKELLKLS